MGMFKEELYQFEDLMRNQHPFLGYRTSREEDQEALFELRNWMKDMADLKYHQIVNGNVRMDIYFIAFEVDAGNYNGAELIIKTSITPEGTKNVLLSIKNATYSLSQFKKRYY
jgi:hypothetical protein